MTAIKTVGKALRGWVNAEHRKASSAVHNAMGSLGGVWHAQEKKIEGAIHVMHNRRH